MLRPVAQLATESCTGFSVGRSVIQDLERRENQSRWTAGAFRGLGSGNSGAICRLKSKPSLVMTVLLAWHTVTSRVVRSHPREINAAILARRILNCCRRVYWERDSNAELCCLPEEEKRLRPWSAETQLELRGGKACAACTATFTTSEIVLQLTS